MSRISAALWQQGLDPITSSVKWMDGQALGHTRAPKIQEISILWQSLQFSVQKRHSGINSNYAHDEIHFCYSISQPLRRRGKTVKGGLFCHILEQKTLSSCLDGGILTLTTWEKFSLRNAKSCICDGWLPAQIIGQRNDM